MTIHEYEKIYSSDCESFKELAKFSAASDFLSIGWQFVQAKSYVGVIRLPSGYQIEILPKLQAADEDLRGILIKMLSTLKDFSGKKFLDAELQTSRMPLYEIYIRIYLKMVLELVKRGLKSDYVLREENLKFLKGKLLVNENLRRNVIHREKFFVAFDEYSLDRPEHRLIKATLIKLLRTTQDNKNFRLASRLLTDFDYVEASNNYSKDFSAVSIDRTNHEYKVIINWTEKFLSGKNFTPTAGKLNAIALLFDMNKLFEAYVAEYVRKIFSERFTVKIQVSERNLFDNSTDYKLKPDIILENSSERIILDTKWKFKITEDDMYQMLAYARRYGTKKIFILSPAAEKIYHSEELELKICNVDLFDMNASIKKLPIA